MQRVTPLDTSLRAYSAGGSRGVVHEVGKEKDEDGRDRDGTADNTFMQELKINMMRDETRERVEHPQNYGFTSHVIKADTPQQGREEDAAAAEHFVQFMGGNRSFPVVQNLDDRRVRLRHLEEGETCVYDDQQQKLHIQRNRIYSRSQFKIEHRVIVDDQKKDGHGRHKVASRDQTKDRSLRLSTLVMDPEWITIERTKPKEAPPKSERQSRDQEEGDWQTGGEEDTGDPEKKLLKCSQIKMGERRMTMTTYRNGLPHLMIDINEETSQISLQTLDEGRPRIEFSLDGEAGTAGLQNHEAPEEGRPGLVFEMDDEFRKIVLMTTRDEKPQLVLELDGPKDKLTLKTNGKTEQLFDNSSSTIHIHADTLVKVGDRNADIPVAIAGCVDSFGYRLVGPYADKVLVK